MSLTMEDFKLDQVDLWQDGKLKRFSVHRYREFAIQRSAVSVKNLIICPEEFANTENWVVLHIPTACAVITPGFPSSDAAIDVIEGLLALRNNWEIGVNELTPEFTEIFSAFVKNCFRKYRPEYAKLIKSHSIPEGVKEKCENHPKLNGYDITPMET